MNIAIVRLSAIGDIVQSMIVLQFIKKKFPYASIDWFIDNQFATLLDDCIEIDNVIKLDLKKIKQNKSLILLFKTLRKLQTFKKYDYVFDLQGLIKSAVISRFIPARERVGFDKNSIREKFASYFYSQKFCIPYDENVIRRYVGIVSKALNIDISDDQIIRKKPFFHIISKENTKSKKQVAIILGASDISKIYPAEKYAEIIANVDANFIALWHSKSEGLTAKKLSLITEKVTLIDCKNFSQLKSLIQNSDLIIGGDTGPTHLAWAMNKSSITIFGPTPLERNFFQTNINMAIKSKSIVNPYKINKKDFSISEINPLDISLMARKLLNITQE